jgi:group I intron endonuclease
MNNILISGSYNVFQNGWNGIGVYMVSGIFKPERIELPIYIGSSVNLKQRICAEHFNDLNSNNHSNQLLQNAWNKHGKDNFIWWLLDTRNKEYTIEYEQKYLDLYKPFADNHRGYNIAHYANAPNRGREGLIIGIKHTEETKRKMSERKRAISKPVKCVETGKIYHSSSSAARENNINWGSFKRSIKFGWAAKG